MRECIVARVPMRHPGDVSEIERLIADGTVAAGKSWRSWARRRQRLRQRLTRAYASDMLKLHLGARLGMTPESGRREGRDESMSGGTEGALSPHFVVIAVRESDPGNGRPIDAGQPPA